MATKVKWRHPDLENDHSIHILYGAEWTLCGLAFEGGSFDPGNQGFVTVRARATCPQCIDRVLFCKGVKSSEMFTWKPK